MLTITCDITGVSETFDLGDIELREGKRPGEWQFLVKGVEKLQHFSPDAINSELGMVLSKEAKADWEKKERSLQEQAMTDRMKVVKDMKRTKKTNKNTTTNMNTP